MLKGTKLYSILTGRCPVCQQESMYESPNLYNPQQTQKMHERCSHCNTKYKIEPSFFYGAMYVSYALGVAAGIATYIISAYLFKLDRLPIFFIIMAVIVLALPVIIRLSRNIWINMFMDYDPEKAKNH